MPGGHQRQIPRAGVVDGDKRRHELPGRIDHREILLVFPHGRDQNFLGNFQELGLETARGRHGVLHQIGNDIHQRLIRQYAATSGRCSPGYFLDHQSAAGIDIGNDMRLPQGVGIGAGLGQFHFPGRHEDVPAAVAAALDVAHAKRYRFVSQQGDDRMNGPGKGDVQVGPAHGLGKRHRQHHLRQQLFQHTPGH